MNRNAQFQGIIRTAQVVFGLIFLFFAAAFYFRWPLVADVWPWTGYSSLSALSSIFIASILAAFGAALLWMAWTGEIRAAVPITIDVIIVLLGTGVFALQDYLQNNSSPAVGRAAILTLVSVPFALAVLWASRQFPLRDKRRMPPALRLIFGLFSAGLLVAGYALLTQAPAIFPWPLPAETSVIYGWAFWGAMGYFLFGLINPYWSYAAGQLIGFLVYDLVLLLPYLAHLSTVTPDHRTSLIVYLVVITFSGLVAIYYCFVNRQTRIWTRQPLDAAALARQGG